ncbi:hypothetical protein A3758_11465 [Oleiphilus sp. HI0118]|nr:hypothetical protein A3758_11465 [Oleiphilus sp. HI0118]
MAYFLKRSLILWLLFILSSPVHAIVEQVRISNNNDDAEERLSNGNMNRGSSDLEMAYDGGNAQLVGLRFRSVNVPQGATINSAYIEFEVDETDSGATNLEIYGQAADNAGGIGNNRSNLSNRTPTSAVVPWSPAPWTSVSDKEQTADISLVIQEIVNRGGWADGNSLMILIRPGSGCNSSACQRTAEARNGESANAPLLVIDYSIGPVTTPIADIEFRMDEDSWSGNAGDVLDSSGNGLDAQSQGGAQTTDDAHLCRAGEFDGVDDYIESADIYSRLRTTASMSFWIKTTQTGNNTGWRAPGIAGVEQAGGSDDIFWGWLDASGRIGLSVGNQYSTKSTVAINDDVYHHVVLTRDSGSGAYKIYIDGSLNRSGTGIAGVIGNSFSSIGRIEDTGGTEEYFRGKLDELRIYSKVLSDAEVTALFNDTRPCASNSLIAHFPFEQTPFTGSGVAIEDYTGNGNNGVTLGDPASNEDGYVCRAIDIPENSSVAIIDAVDSQVDVNDDLGDAGTIMLWYRAEQDWVGSGNRTLLDASTRILNNTNDKYFYLAKLNSGALRFSLEDAADGDFNLTSPVNTFNAGDWVHLAITWDMPADELKIFANGTEVASQTFNTNGVLGDVGSVFFGDNSSTYNIAPASSAFGTLDELRLYDTVLTAVEIIAASAETQPCVDSCAGSFATGINSHANGTVDFGFNAQILNNPTTILPVGSVVTNGGSGQLSCESSHCSAEPGSVAAISPGTFPNTASYSETLNIGFSSVGILGQTTNGYANVTLGSQATMSVSPAYNEYFIDTMNVGFNSDVNLIAGDYWINQLTLGSQVRFNVVGGGTARVFVNQTLNIGSSNLLNASGVNDFTGVTASSLLLYAYSDIGFPNSATMAGVVYAVGDVSFVSTSYLSGAVTANNISLGSNSKISYDSSGVSTLDFGGICDPTSSCALGSFSISQPQYSLACPQTRALVQVQAMCADGLAAKSDYSGTINLSSNESTLSDFYLASTGGSPISTYTFDGSESGTRNFYLFHQNENSDLRVTVEDSFLAISSSATSGTDFRTSGFLASSPASFVCGASSNFTLTAFGQDLTGGGSCNVLTGFDGSKNLKVWSDVNTDIAQSPGVKDTGLPRSILFNGVGVSETQPASINVSANFNAGVASVALAYDDVGEVLGLNVLHDEAPYDGSVPEFSALAVTVDPFVVSPQRITIQADDANAACAGGSQAALAACSVLTSAGSNFSVTAQAECNGGGSAPSYQGTVGLSHQLISPSGGNLGGLARTSLVFDGTESVPGSRTLTDQQVSEVGVFSLTTSPQAYFGQTVAGSTSANIGRFTPADFVVAPDDGRFAANCGSFTYIGQPFTYATLPSASITARNANGVTTENYTDNNFRKLVSADVADALIPPTQDDLKDGTSVGVKMPVTASLNDGALSVLSPGVMLYTFDNGDTYNYDKDANALVAPFTVNQAAFSQLEVSANTIDDSDLVAVSNSPVWRPVGIEQRYGRWRTENVFGPEDVALNMLAQAEYWDGAGFLVNVDDICSAIDIGLSVNDSDGNAVSAPYAGISVGDGSSDMSFNSTLANGSGQFRFSPPGLASAGDDHTGSIGVVVDLGTMPWLRFNWDASADGSLEDAPLRFATFGQYRGNDRIIYWREVFP